MDILALENGARLIKEWHPTRNGDKQFTDITVSSCVWWVCGEGHEWESLVSNRIKGSNCVYCCNQRVLAGFNDLATTHPVIAAQWHPTRNGDVTPGHVSFGTHKKVWWVCDVDNSHEWEADISNRASKLSGCPLCGYSVSKAEIEWFESCLGCRI
jgi:hypothetical protein